MYGSIPNKDANDFCLNNYSNQPFFNNAVDFPQTFLTANGPPLIPFMNPMLQPLQVPPSFFSNEEMEEGDIKQQRKRRSRLNNPAALIKDKRKRRLEQNRLSAKESRKKKKDYIQSLEMEVQRLKQDLRECKMWAAEIMSRNITQTITYVDNVLALKNGTNQMIDKIIMASNQKDLPAVETTLQSLIIRYGIQSEERKKVTEDLLGSIIDCCFPRTYGYFLFMAKNNSKTFTESNSQIEECKNVWNDLDKLFNLSPLEIKIIENAKESLNKYFDEIDEKIKLFVSSKKNLYEELTKMDSFVNENILSKLNPISIANYLKWVQSFPENITTNNLLYTTPKLITNEYKENHSKMIERDSIDMNLTIKKHQEVDDVEVRPLKRPNIFD